MKINVWLETGFAGCVHRDTLEIDDDELTGMSFDEKQKWIEGYVESWSNDFLNIGWEELDTDT